MDDRFQILLTKDESAFAAFFKEKHNLRSKADVLRRGLALLRRLEEQERQELVLRDLDDGTITKLVLV